MAVSDQAAAEAALRAQVEQNDRDDRSFVLVPVRTHLGSHQDVGRIMAAAHIVGLAAEVIKQSGTALERDTLIHVSGRTGLVAEFAVAHSRAVREASQGAEGT